LVAVVDAVGRALALDPALLAEAGHPRFLPVASGVALLAGASTMVGHSVILFLNRVRGLRFALAIVGTGLWAVFFFLLQGLVVGVVGRFAFGRSPAWIELLSIVFLSAAPLCFNFLILIPHFGPFIGRVLEVWAFFILLVGVAVAFDVTRWLALAITVAGWLVRHTLARLVARPVSWLSARVWRFLTGGPILVTAYDVLAGHLFVDAMEARR
jgi:hypothetical protein